MKVDLSGLRALVTGSTKGIGRAIAHALAKNGAEVAINGRKPADVEQAIAAIRATLPTARLVPAPGDAATAQGVAAIIKAAGDVDILVNNVGIFEIKNAFDIPDEDWQRLFATNVLSGVRFTRHYGSGMRDKGFGRIVFISSESGVQIPTEMIHYGFTKSADLALDARVRPGAGGNRRHRQRRAAGADPHRRRRGDVQVDGPVARRSQG